nr:hypothetical protein [Tanacetum cinerariifolium]
MLLAKKDKYEQVLLVEDHARMESSSDSDQEINANMVFMAQIEKVLSDSEASSSPSDDKIAEIVQICLWIIDSGRSKHMTGQKEVGSMIPGRSIEVFPDRIPNEAATES